jgi:hypothetical protein
MNMPMTPDPIEAGKAFLDTHKVSIICFVVGVFIGAVLF